MIMQMIDTGREVLEVEAKAILQSIKNLDISFNEAIDILGNTKGRIVVTGMGKSGLIGKKISATMTSTGSPSVFLHPSEAMHGDLGIINPEDTILALSTSGETSEVVRLLTYIKRIGVKIVSLVGNVDSTLAKESDVYINCQIEKEAGEIGMVPTASTTLMLAMGDAISVALMRKNKFSEDDFRNFHPGGNIGKKLLKVKQCMRKEDDLPVAGPGTLMKDVIMTIDKKKLGVAIIVDEHKNVLGIITDGDLRRAFLNGENFLKKKASCFMTKNPSTILEDNFAVEALRIMEEKKITSLIVTKGKKLNGFIHLHDLWRTEMI